MSGGELIPVPSLHFPPVLQVILLDNNLLTELPGSLAGLSRLEVLTHSGNILSSPPASVLATTVGNILAWLGENQREEEEEMKSKSPAPRLLTQEGQLSSKRRRSRSRSVLRGNPETEWEEEEEEDSEEDNNVHLTERWEGSCQGNIFYIDFFTL